MSDFLGNLARRALGLETGVRPRSPSLFGPLADSVVAPRIAEFAEETSEATALPPLQPSRRRQQMVAGAENFHSETSRAIPTFNRPVTAATAPARLEETAPSTQNRSRESTASFVPAEIRPTLARDEFTSRAPVRGAAFPSVPAPPERIVRESVRETFRTEVIAPSEAPRMEKVPASPAVAPQISQTSARVAPRPPAPSPVVPTITRAAPAAPTFDEKRDEVAAQPTIHVTIGRIEVRATAAPARKPTSNAAAPTGALSLDDYLSQRAGGQR